MYETSIRIMIGYVARKYKNGYGIKIILNELKMPTLEKPKLWVQCQTTWIETSTEKT